MSNPVAQPQPGVQPGVYVAPSAGVGPLRHLASLVIAVVAVPLGLLALDFAIGKRLTEGVQIFRDSPPPLAASAGLVVACVLLLIAAAAGRISGLGPLAAALLWGVLPSLWAWIRPIGFAKALRRLPDLYDFFSFGLSGFALIIFPLVAVLLLGAAVSGRWRGAR